MTMVEYIIELLTKVSFDNELFIKELCKSRRWLNQDEWDTLLLWVHEYHTDKLVKCDQSVLVYEVDCRQN